MSWHGFLWVYLAWGLLSFSNLKVCITSHQIWGVFSHYFFKCFFSFKGEKSFSLSGPLMIRMNVKYFVIISQIHESHHFQSLFCYSERVNSIWSVLKFTDSILSCYLHSAIESIQNFSFLLCAFQFYNFLFFFFVSSACFSNFNLFQGNLHCRNIFMMLLSNLGRIIPSDYSQCCCQ